ncbi:MAG: DUF3786 domain-containing protein [Syntrophorhabdales bacterium]|jgi:hypothetical protein
MFITDGVSNYDRVCEDLLALVEKTGASANAPLLGGRVTVTDALIPVFGEECAVRRDGVYKDERRLDTIGSILVVRYLLQAGTEPLAHSWLPYRDLKDGAQFSSYIKANIEDKIALSFSGKRDVLEERLTALGAEAYAGGEMPGDLVRVVHPLPKVPVLCLFWEADEEFPPSFQFLFDSSAPSYLDLESLAVVLEYIYLKVAGEG